MKKKDTPLSPDALRDFIKSKRKANQEFILDNLTAKAILHEDGASDYSRVLESYGLKLEKTGAKLENKKMINIYQLVDDSKSLTPSKLKKRIEDSKNNGESTITLNKQTINTIKKNIPDTAAGKEYQKVFDENGMKFEDLDEETGIIKMGEKVRSNQK